MTEPDGWKEWSKYVLLELERLNTCYNNLDAKVNKINVEIAMLKVKSGIWGALGGILVAIPPCLFFMIKFMK